MAGTLTVWKFPSETGADTAVHTLKELQGQRLIIVHDAATVIWHAGANKPRVRQLNNMAGKGALGGAFWGLLFGLLFVGASELVFWGYHFNEAKARDAAIRWAEAQKPGCTVGIKSVDLIN